MLPHRSIQINFSFFCASFSIILCHTIAQPFQLKVYGREQGFQVVELTDILYAEAYGNYTNFYFSGKQVICSSKPIHEYEDLLDDAGFVRIHKSYLVNLLHVKEYVRGEGGSVILSNAREVEVSRRKKDVFLEKMKSFYKY